MNPTATDCLLLIAPGCPHCPSMLEGLGKLLKEGVIGRLEAVNIAVRGEVAAELGVRSVPWLRIGEFEFEGLMNLSELRDWAGTAAGDQGWPAYFAHLLEHRRLDRAISLIRQQPQRAKALVTPLATLETPMAVRIGIGAVIEELEGSGALHHALEPLIAQTRAAEPQIRADAAHYLAFVHHPDALAAIKRCLADDDAEVREIAAESLEHLSSHG